MKDKSLTAGARFFYCALDDLSGFKGESWYLQSTLAERYGVGPRSVRKWLSELSQYVTVLRRQRAAVYLLSWSDRHSGATLKRADRHSDATQIGTRVPLSSLLVNQELEPSAFTCGKCEDLGVVAGSGACDCFAGIQVTARLRRRRA